MTNRPGLRELASRARRHELLRTAPYWGVAAVLAGVMLGAWVWWTWVAALTVASSMLPGVGFLLAYLSALRGGRTVSPAAFVVDVDGGMARVAIGEVSARFQLLEVTAARMYVDACPFEALRGLVDVLELEIDGVVLRVPDTAAGFTRLSSSVHPQFIEVE